MAQAQRKRPPRRRRPPEAPPPEKLALNVEEVAYVLGCSVPSVWTMLREGVLPRMRLGRHTRISRAAVEAFIAAGGTDELRPRKAREAAG